MLKIKYIIILFGVASIFSTHAIGESYNKRIDLKDIILKNNDSVTVVGEREAIFAGASNLNPIDLGAGKIEVKFTAATGTVSNAIQLQDGLTHNLGVGTKVTGIGDYELNAVYLEGTNFLADSLIIDVSSNKNSNGIYASSNANVNLGNGSKIDIENKRDSAVWNTATAIYLSNSKLEANDLTLNAKGLSSGVILDGGSHVDLGSNSIINAGFMGVLMQGDNVFKANQITINLNRAYNISADISAAIHSNNGNNSFDLGSNSKINVVGDDANAINLYSGEIKANNINIKTEGNNATAILLENAKAEFNGATITTTSGIAAKVDKKSEFLINDSNIETNNSNTLLALAEAKIFANNLNIVTGDKNTTAIYSSDSEINIKGSNINTSTAGNALYAINQGIIKLDGNNLIITGRDKTALHASGNASAINQQGKLNLVGDILATNNAHITLATDAQSVVTGQVSSSTSGVINWTGNNTQWNMTKSSVLNNLNLSNNSHVNLAHAANYSQLEVNNLSGNSLFTFKIDLVGNQSDSLHVLNTSAGQHKVALVNNGAANTTGAERKDIIFTQDGVANFSSDKDYELGGYLYKVRRKNDDPNSTIWEVAGTKDKTNPSEGSLASVVSNYLLNLAEQENLQKRMGELRNNPNEYGAWVRSYTGKFNSFSSRQLKGFDMDYSGIQLGVDGKLTENANGAWFLGAGVSYTGSNQDYKFGSGKQKSTSFALYGSYLSEDDWYLDMYAKYSKYRNKLDVRDSIGQKVKGTGNNNSYTLSVEAGKRYYLYEDKKFYIEPNAQLTTTQLSASTIKNSNGLRVKFDHQVSTVVRGGSNVGYLIDGDAPINLYAKVNLARETDGKQVYYLNGSREKINFSGNWVELGIGAHAQVNDNHHLFFELNNNIGKRFDKYDANIGYRFTF